jgi:hypothetical protein
MSQPGLTGAAKHALVEIYRVLLRHKRSLRRDLFFSRGVRRGDRFERWALGALVPLAAARPHSAVKGVVPRPGSPGPPRRVTQAFRLSSSGSR